MILKLMIVEIKRYLRSLYYLVVLFILFLIHMLGLKGGVSFLFWGDDFLENVNFICIVLSLLMSVYICDEFSYGTVQNKLYLGYKKSQIYIAEVIACSVCGSSLVLLDSLFYLLGCFLRKQELTHSFSYIMTNTLIFMITIGSVSVIICSFSLLAKKRLITQFLLVFFAIFLINSGRKTLATLTDYESVFVEINEENDPASKDLIESFTEELNATYRTQLNMKITLSPYAQCNFSSYITTERPEDKPKQSFLFKNRDYHIDFVIADVILSLFIILVSVNIFKKQNI